MEERNIPKDIQKYTSGFYWRYASKLNVPEDGKCDLLKRRGTDHSKDMYIYIL